MSPFLKKTAAAAIATLMPMSAVGADFQSPAYTLSKSDLEASEDLAFRIAEALYRIDYLNPEIDTAVVDGVILPILEDAQPSPDMRRYIGEILDVWFVSQPRIVESVARIIPEHSQRLDLASLDADRASFDSTQSIPKLRRILLLKPPGVVSRGSSDY